jgi:multiple sugar transport system substrate-binding protein
MKKHQHRLLFIVLVGALVLSACQSAPATPAPTDVPMTEPTATTAAEPTQETMAEATATSAPEASATPEQAPDEWTDVDPSGQTIIFWHNHSQARQETLDAIIQKFNETNEYGITVEEEYQGAYDDIFNKMLPILNTADVPDLVVAYQNQAATYQLSDALVDMNSLANSAKWGLSAEDQADFFPGFYQQDVNPSFGDARLGFPPNRSAEVLYANQTWLSELGYSNLPTSPDEFREMACKASQTAFSKSTADSPIGYELSLDASRMASWTFAFGGDIFDYDNNQYTLNSEAAVNAMTFLQGLFQDGCATQVVEDYGDQTDFGAGKLLFSIGSSSGLPYYKQAVDEGATFDWTIGLLPYSDSPVLNVYGASVSIPKSTPERELAAWIFLKYYTSPEPQAEWAKATNYFPVRASVAADLTDYFASDPTYKTGFDLLKYAHFEPPVPGYDFVREEMQKSMAAIVDGADVKTTLDALNETANGILADQMSQIK